jgi:hypothetical protein
LRKGRKEDQDRRVPEREKERIWEVEGEEEEGAPVYRR